MSERDLSRRDFLKHGIIGAMAVAATGVKKANAEGLVWSEGMQINPDIDNLRVVSCKDENMVLEHAPIMNFSNIEVQNNAANPPVIYENMDAMAMALSQKSSPLEAWATIFRKPVAKSWNQVLVAIKVNGVSPNHPRVAVIAKICNALNSLGVPFQNIIVYDAAVERHNAYRLYHRYTGNGLPDGVRVSDRDSLLGGTVSVTLPVTGDHKCPAYIADGTIDILVNCAINKGHLPFNGNCTMTMKNHYGTFSPESAPNSHSSMDYIYAINKSDAILGGTPARQQLCIIDSLWARNTFQGDPDKNTFRLIMGTFAPAVDYLTVKKVREEEMGEQNNQVVEGYLTSFGYTDAQRDTLSVTSAEHNDGRGWVEVVPGSTKKETKPVAKTEMNSSLQHKVIAGRSIFTFSTTIDGVYTAEIYSLKGRVVAKRKKMVKKRVDFIFEGLQTAAGSYSCLIKKEGKIVARINFVHK